MNPDRGSHPEGFARLSLFAIDLEGNVETGSLQLTGTACSLLFAACWRVHIGALVCGRIDCLRSIRIISTSSRTSCRETGLFKWPPSQHLKIEIMSMDDLTPGGESWDLSFTISVKPRRCDYEAWIFETRMSDQVRDNNEKQSSILGEIASDIDGGFLGKDKTRMSDQVRDNNEKLMNIEEAIFYLEREAERSIFRSMYRGSTACNDLKNKTREPEIANENIRLQEKNLNPLGIPRKQSSILGESASDIDGRCLGKDKTRMSDQVRDNNEKLMRKLAPLFTKHIENTLMPVLAPVTSLLQSHAREEERKYEEALFGVDERQLALRYGKIRPRRRRAGLSLRRRRACSAKPVRPKTRQGHRLM